MVTVWFWSGKKFSQVLALLCTGVITQSAFPEMAIWFSLLGATVLAITKEQP